MTEKANKVGNIVACVTVGIGLLVSAAISIPHILSSPVFASFGVWALMALYTAVGGLCFVLIWAGLASCCDNLKLSDFAEIVVDRFCTSMAMVMFFVSFVLSVFYFRFDGKEYFERKAERAETGIVVDLSVEYSEGEPDCKVKIRQELTYNGETRTFDIWYENVLVEKYQDLEVGDEVEVLSLYEDDPDREMPHESQEGEENG